LAKKASQDGKVRYVYRRSLSLNYRFGESAIFCVFTVTHKENIARKSLKA